MRHVMWTVRSYLLLWVVISFNAIEGFNISVRHRRDDEIAPPDILKVKYHHQGDIKLAVLFTVPDSTLIGLYTAVRLLYDNGTWSDEETLYSNGRHRPIFYHGKDSFSAITYFPKTQTLHGVIDEIFYVADLPLVHASDPNEVKKFIHPIPNELRNVMSTRTRNRRNDELASGGIRKNMTRQRRDESRKVLWPEISLVVDAPLPTIGTVDAEDFEKSIMYTIAYWNAIDMLFRNLKHTDVRISIVKIAITKTSNIDYLASRDYFRDIDTDLLLLKEGALNNFGRYFYNENRVARNSFDFLIWMTSATLVDLDAWYEDNAALHYIKKVYTGALPKPTDCGGMRKIEHKTRIVLNRAIVMYDDEFAQYHTVARHLAHLMFVPGDDDVLRHGRHQSNCLPSNPRIESSGIMDPFNYRLKGHLFWSYCAEIHFERYSKSQSSCCLLNYPVRTFGLPSTPYRLTIEMQCECYGMQAFNRDAYQGDICGANLKCKNAKGRSTKIGLPLDYTRCNPEFDFDTCYYGECL